MVRPLSISAPGSLMLLGEHAVLHGHSCLVAAIEKRIRLSLIPRNDGLVNITSALGEYQGDRDDLPEHPSFRFLVGTLNHHANVLPGGLDVTIQADMPSTIGFGTSAAVTVAMTGALQLAANGSWSLPEIFLAARTIIQQVQGRGSGADAAASAYGGVVHYNMDGTGAGVVYNEPSALAAVYCGYKTPTPEVISRVEQAWSGKTEERDRLYARMGDTVLRGKAALAACDDKLFGQILDEGHTLMQQLGVSTKELDECAETLRNEPHIHGAKISGSGLGDCVVGWGIAEKVISKFQRFDLIMAPEGIRLE